uniref:2-deoxy-D-gluconate 3-dehydrogenase n=1 Tax=uncultured bacterium contig00097 TaxID=1181566 RepID=A0A806K1X2_9BACT|nr:2-deoxy-D-gluconate 3-dehydrogenase [uncultured bacterium contig00097]
MELFSLKGKTAIVTGGNRGLGRSISEAFAMAGARVAIIASSDGVFEAAEDFRAKGYDVIAVQCDLSDECAIASAFDSAVAKLGGGLDVLVNNAGIQRRSKCEDFSMSDWDDVLNVNLRAVFTLCQLAGRRMIPHGGGKIINLASLLSFTGGVTVPAYAAAKGGVAQLTKALSNEWASKGINVNAIAPGYMATEMNAALLSDEKRNAEILSRIPAGRWGAPEDIMGIAVFLASSASDYVSGAVIPVDGGFLGR